MFNILPQKPNVSRTRPPSQAGSATNVRVPRWQRRQAPSWKNDCPAFSEGRWVVFYWQTIRLVGCIWAYVDAGQCIRELLPPGTASGTVLTDDGCAPFTRLLVRYEVNGNDLVYWFAPAVALCETVQGDGGSHG